MTKIYILKIKLLLSVCLIVALSLTSCEKESAEGPKGEKGEQGEQGIAGADGSTMLSGSGAPATSLGKTGDYYLDKTAAAIYGPKTSAGWGAATSLKGDTGNSGANGKDGSKMLSGVGVPAVSLGAIGDFYFDTQNIAIYGPKTATSWGVAVSLKAPEANGVKVLLYKNHAFQSVVRNTSNEAYLQGRLVTLAEEKVSAEASIANYQQQYNQTVASAQNSLQQGWINQSQYDQQIAQALQNFNDYTAYSREWLVSITNEKLSVEKELAIGRFNITSNISIDAKYHDIYDNGMLMVYIRKANDANAGWNEDLSLIKEEGSNYKYLDVYINNHNTLKNQFSIEGYSYLVPEAEIKAARIDIKVVLIPASSVEIMTAKKINTKDLLAVSKFLGV